MCQVRSNQGVTKDNLTTPSPPVLVPPVLFIAPWLFEVLGHADAPLKITTNSELVTNRLEI